VGLRTVREAAERLGIGYSTLKLWISRGYARSTTTAGGHHRLSDAEIERLATHQAPNKSSRQAPAGNDDFLAGLSARNRLRGFVEEVRVEGLLAQVRLRIGDQRLTAVITRDAVDALRLRRGDEAFAIIKSTEVMVAARVGGAPRPPARGRRRSRRTARTSRN